MKNSELRALIRSEVKRIITEQQLSRTINPDDIVEIDFVTVGMRDKLYNIHVTLKDKTHQRISSYANFNKIFGGDSFSKFDKVSVAVDKAKKLFPNAIISISEKDVS